MVRLLDEGMNEIECIIMVDLYEKIDKNKERYG